MSARTCFPCSRRGDVQFFLNTDDYSRNFSSSPHQPAYFQIRSSKMTRSPVLPAPDLSKSFKLSVEAEPVLYREVNLRAEGPRYYFTCKFNRHQLNYSATEEETGTCSRRVFISAATSSICSPGTWNDSRLAPSLHLRHLHLSSSGIEVSF